MAEAVRGREGVARVAGVDSADVALGLQVATTGNAGVAAVGAAAYRAARARVMRGRSREAVPDQAPVVADVALPVPRGGGARDLALVVALVDAGRGRGHAPGRGRVAGLPGGAG